MDTLSPEEGRVLGCLIEKQMTTPEYYPMTVNALVAACNQKTNREPVVDYDEETIEKALRDLNDRNGLAKFTRSPGARAIKYVHKAGDVLEVDDQQLALVAVLLLRGPQTPGELRARTDRYATFTSVAEVEDILSDLIHRDIPLVEQLDRGPGQREDRYRTLLLPEMDYSPRVTPRTEGLAERVEALERRIAAIEAALEVELPEDL